MRRARDVPRVADLNHGSCTREWEPEADLQCRRSLLDRQFGVPACFLRIAGDYRVGRIGGTLTVDVGARREDAGTGEPVGRDHLAELDELLVPLPRIAKGRHAVAQLTKRQFRIVFDVEVHVHETRDDRPAGEIQPFGAGRQLHRVCRADTRDAIAVNDDAAGYRPAERRCRR